MYFTKMQGLGNDYVILNCLKECPPELPELAVRLSDRHFGIGSDGLICLRPGRLGTFAMEMYNADGSRGAMCGNGIRCLGKYLYDRGLTQRTDLTIDTDAGMRALHLRLGPAGVEAIQVDMGASTLLPELTLTVAGALLSVVPVSIGNPHCVIFCPDPDQIPLASLGPALECHPVFPGRTNVEFAAVEGDLIRLRVWERGSGETMACGTGACAAFAAARHRGLCSSAVTVRLPGGELALSIDPETEHILMAGPAVTVFTGEY